MLKNIRIGVKLIVVGTLIMVIPLLVVALMAITKSTQGLSAVENEQLAGRSSDIAQLIDKVFEEEKKLSLSFAIDPDIVAAARAVSEKSAVSAEKQTPVAEKPAAGKVVSSKAAPVPVVDSGAAATAELIDRVSAKIKPIHADKRAGREVPGSDVHRAGWGAVRCLRPRISEYRLL